MTVIPPETDLIFDAGAKLLACLQVEVEKLALVPKNIGFLPGQAVLEDISVYEDLCCDGTAYVRNANIYPSGEKWPAPDTGQDPCAPIAWAATFEMGIMRCAPTGSANAIVSRADWQNVNSQYFIDAQALRAAVCCYKTMYSSGPSDGGVLIGQVVPIGPQGGCIVASLTVVVQTIGCGLCS